MTNRFAAIALIPVLTIAQAVAQAPNAGNEASSARGTLTPPVATATPIAADARPRADADARDCLDFVSNVGVIRCAEKYRSHPKAGSRPR